MNENEIIEEWRDVVGYEGLYEVSNIGRVKSLIDNHGKPREKNLKQYLNHKGYLIVKLYKECDRKTCKVHRLVANAFIPNPSNLKCVNHKDENKTNNCVDNLEWCDNKYNINYGTCIQRRVEKLINRQDQSKQVYQYDKDGNLIKIWESANECKRNGFKQSAVSACCLGKRKSHKGYIWSYIPL